MRNGLRRWLLAGVVASLSCTLLADIEKTVAFPAGGGTDDSVVFETTVNRFVVSLDTPEWLTAETRIRTSDSVGTLTIAFTAKANTGAAREWSVSGTVKGEAVKITVTQAAGSSQASGTIGFPKAEELKGTVYGGWYNPLHVRYTDPRSDMTSYDPIGMNFFEGDAPWLHLICLNRGNAEVGFPAMKLELLSAAGKTIIATTSVAAAPSTKISAGGGRPYCQQWSAFKSLAAGEYMLRVTLDPDQATADADRSDNVAEFYFTVQKNVPFSPRVENGVLKGYEGRCPAQYTIPGTVREIENFQSDTLEELTLPSSVTKIEGYAFVYCSALKKINFAEGLQQIGQSAFEGCPKLTSVMLPASVVSVGFMAFEGCPIKTVQFQSKSTVFNTLAFSQGVKLSLTEWSEVCSDSLQSVAYVGKEGVLTGWRLVAGEGGDKSKERTFAAGGLDVFKAVAGDPWTENPYLAVPVVEESKPSTDTPSKGDDPAGDQPSAGPLSVAVSVGADGGKVTSKAVSVASGSRWHFNGNAVPDWITSVVVRYGGSTLTIGRGLDLTIGVSGSLTFEVTASKQTAASERSWTWDITDAATGKTACALKVTQASAPTHEEEPKPSTDTPSKGDDPAGDQPAAGALSVAVSVGADGGKVTSKAVSVASGSRWHFNGNAVPDWVTSVVVRYGGSTLTIGRGLDLTIGVSGSLTFEVTASKQTAASERSWTWDITDAATGKTACALKVTQASGSQASSVPTHEFVVGVKKTVKTGWKGYAVKNLPKGLTYDSSTGYVSGKAKAKTVAKGVKVTFTKKSTTKSMTVVVRAENLSVSGKGLDGAKIYVGVKGAANFPIASSAESGVSSVKVSGCPSGLSYDKKAKAIVGTPTKTGKFKVKVTVTAKSGATKSKTFSLKVVALPSYAVGTFNGYATVKGTPAYATFSVKSNGSISGKITLNGKAYSFKNAAYASCDGDQAKFTPSIKIGKKTYKPQVNVYKLEGSLEVGAADGGTADDKVMLMLCQQQSLIKKGKPLAKLVGYSKDLTFTKKTENAGLTSSRDKLQLSFASGDKLVFKGVVGGKTLPSGSAAVHCFWAEKDGSVTRYTLEAEIISPTRKYYRLVGFDVEVVTKSGKVKSVTPYFNPLTE